MMGRNIRLDNINTIFYSEIFCSKGEYVVLVILLLTSTQLYRKSFISTTTVAMATRGEIHFISCLRHTALLLLFSFFFPPPPNFSFFYPHFFALCLLHLFHAGLFQDTLINTYNITVTSKCTAILAY